MLFDLGRVVHEEVDYRGAAPSLLRFSRHYDSSGRLQGSLPQAMGQNWTHNYEIYLYPTRTPLSSFEGKRQSTDGSPAYFPVGYDFSRPRSVNPQSLRCELDDAKFDGKCYPLLHPSAAVYMALQIGAMRLYFQSTDGVNWRPDADISATLTKTASGWVYVDADQAVWQFDASYNPQSVRYRDGTGLTFTVDTGTRSEQAPVILVKDSFGNKLYLVHTVGILATVFAQNADDDLMFKLKLFYDTAEQDPSGLSVGRGYAWLKSIRYRYYFPGAARNSELERRYGYTYNQNLVGAPFQLRTVTDERGIEAHHFDYDENGLAIRADDGAGIGEYRFRYFQDEQGQIHSVVVTRPLGDGMTITMENKGNRMVPASASYFGQTSNPQKPTQFTFTQLNDADGRKIGSTDGTGVVTQIDYDTARNLPIKVTEAKGTAFARYRHTQYQADRPVPYWWSGPLLQQGAVPDPATGLVTDFYEQATTDKDGAQGLVTSNYIAGKLRKTHYERNAMGQIKTVTDPLGRITTFDYLPGSGQLTTVTNALGHVTTYTDFDLEGRPQRMIDPNQVSSILRYDSRSKLYQIDRGLGGKTTYGYDAAGNLHTITSADGDVLTYDYDDGNRLTTITDALGNRVVYTLDGLGNRKETTVYAASGERVRHSGTDYEQTGKPMSRTAGGKLQAEYDYDTNGNLWHIKLPAVPGIGARTITQTYDLLGRLDTRTDANGKVSKYEYNGQDRLVKVTDPKGNVTSYTINGFGEVLEQQSPDTGLTTYTYDLVGNLETVTDAKKQITKYTYDDLNRPKTATYADGSKVVNTYDTAPYGIGKLAEVQEYDAGGQLVRSSSYRYNWLGQLETVSQTVGGQTESVGYRYTRGGRLAGLRYPSGREISYEFDAAMQIQKITLNDNGRSTVLASDIRYEPFGGISSFTNGAGQSVTRGYDEAGRVRTYNLAGQLIQQDYDEGDRLKSQFDLLNPGTSGNYRYNRLDQLTYASLPGKVYGYDYDPNGNRTLGQGGTDASYAPGSNRMQSMTTAGVSRNVELDPNGSTTRDATNGYVFDARGRLKSATTASGPVSFELNAMGQRVRKQGASGDTVFQYDLGGHLLSERHAKGRKEHIWLGDMPIAVIQ
ncbi:DUF6531 domain-containing protein [Chitinimonas sp.]|uniref:DUF6531 domain-containing protein n=1 Tax=Chitinimonas sp. TaxID=1934313 RepID=UPI0035B28FC9